MSSIELKQRIINEVNSITDDSILEEIYQLLRVEKSGLYELTDLETKAVQEGLDDSKAGRIFSSEKANQLLQEWLKKK